MRTWFLGRSVASKQLLAFSLLALVIAVLGLGSTWVLRRANLSLRSIYDDRVVCLRQLNAVGDAFAIDIVDVGQQARLRRLAPAEAARRVRLARTRSDAEWAAYTATYLTPAEARLVEATRAPLDGARMASDRLVAVLERDDRAALEAFVDHDMLPAFRPLSVAVAALAELQLGAAKDVVDGANGELVISQRATWTAVVLSAALSVGLGLFLARLIGRPALAVADALRRAAEGDFTARVAIEGTDELGQMAQAFNQAMERVGAVLAQVDVIARELSERAGELHAASTEGAADAQTQAAALEQAAASLEEISGTVQENAAIANQVAAESTASRETAESAGLTVAGAVEAMAEIRAVSTEIEKIVGSIDEIASQTNLLALNAAVEAARAGAHGRGFAVVAGEIRSLALRARDSSRQIRSLVGETAARVDDGTARVARSVEALDRIVGTVKHISLVVGDFAEASREQSAGVAQVTTSVAHIDSITRGSSARTEELAATATLVSSEASRLLDLVATFRLPGAPEGPARRPTRRAPELRPAA